MVIELSDGTLFVSGYDANREMNPNLWRSRDQGSSWELVNVGKKEDGAIGNSDVDLARGTDDTLYFVTMGFDAKAGGGYACQHWREPRCWSHVVLERAIRESI